MKTIVLSLLAASALAVALPAAAQTYGGTGGYVSISPGAPGYGQPSYGQSGYGQPSYNDGYDNGGYDNDRGDYGYRQDGRGDFHSQLERLAGRVQRDASQGDLQTWQARRLMSEIGGLRQLERRYRSSGGYLDGRERMDLQNRLQYLRQEVRDAHGPRYDDDRYGQDGYGDAYRNDEDYWNADRGDRGPRTR